MPSEESKEQLSSRSKTPKTPSKRAPPLTLTVDSENGSNSPVPSQQSTSRNNLKSSKNSSRSQSVTARQSLSSASPTQSPKPQRTVEETLGFWPVPVILGANPSPILTLVLDNRPNELLTHMQSLPLHTRYTAVNQCHDDDGNPVLFHCLAPTHSQCLSLLLDYGADISSVNDKRNTALHIACYYQYKKAIQTLIEFGANLKYENIEHLQCHQLLKGDKVAATQNYCNQIYEQTQEKIASKVITIVEPSVRAYYRGVFDIADEWRLGAIPYSVVQDIVNNYIATKRAQDERDNPVPIVRLSRADREKAKEQEKENKGSEIKEEDWAMKFFNSLDLDHNGNLSFYEFLVAMLQLQADLDSDTKGKTKSKPSKKGKKKK